MTLTAPDAADAMVTLKGVSKSFGTVEALKAVDLSVPKGQFFSLLGPSGSGKTTLLNLISGSFKPTAGRVFIDGQDATDLHASKRGLGMVFQHYALMPHMSIFDNIAFPLKIRKVPSAEIKRRVEEVLELVHLPGVGDRRPKELSGGQQQRVSLARCIVYRPSLILMDEPLGALDKKLRKEMQLEISRLHRELGITMVYVTHDQEEALTMSDQIVVMRDGQIEQIGTAEELYFRPANPYTADFIGDSNLIPGRVSALNGSVQVALQDGGTIAALSEEGLSVGDGVQILIRPESAIVQKADTASDMPGLTGELTDTMVFGAVVKHFIRLPNGRMFEATEINRRGLERLALGAQVRVSWRVEDGLVLRNRV
ncbi:ABC transporter ATP-binding protein [Rhodospirillaceae bacterium KN72]|uniref:ABC transporter ATP-binding protein n=1 Tax=Pacificispira spongiicola TaxID=2729598 RepID=A0A7Y0HCV5_9PROT|nr:ABC transporter ATP-binding protein [Pacificispira spongiicola]NMM43116.1 ABC transporter ATP-binding protein [Pacificispira spongiicola]